LPFSNEHWNVPALVTKVVLAADSRLHLVPKESMEELHFYHLVALISAGEQYQSIEGISCRNLTVFELTLILLFLLHFRVPTHP